MEQRIGMAEGDIRSLQEWRTGTVEPWLRKSETFHSRTETFMTTFEATEEVRDKLNAERHRSNSMKLNVLMVIAAFLAVVFSALLALITYESAHQKSFLNLPAIHAASDMPEYDAHLGLKFDSSIPPTIAQRR